MAALPYRQPGTTSSGEPLRVAVHEAIIQPSLSG